MSNILGPFLGQLASQTPVLLVYVVGTILALVFWRWYRVPCALTLLACALMLLVSVIQTFAFQYLFHARLEQDWEQQKFGWMLSAVQLIGNFLYALGLGLLLAAVFLGRRVPPWAGPPEEPAARSSDLPRNDAITER